MKKIILNTILAGLFMNFIYPEIQFQFYKIKSNKSLAEVLSEININELNINSEKLIDNFGNLNKNFIEKISYDYSNNHVKNNLINNKEILPVSNLNTSEARRKILTESKKYLGIPYSFGSKDPKTGFDCSGFVSYVYKKSINYNLPQGSKYQFSNGGGILVNYEDLQPGDLMFFSHTGKSINHVGIYVGEEKFIHAPKTGRRISVDNVGRYWKKRFVKGRSLLK